MPDDLGDVDNEVQARFTRRVISKLDNVITVEIDALGRMRPVLPILPVVELPLPQMRAADLTVSASYRDALTRPPRPDPEPRRGLRSIGYLGNTLALRARPAPAWRLVGAWLRGAMVRLWRVSMTEWVLCFRAGWQGVIQPRLWYARRAKAPGTNSGGPT